MVDALGNSEVEGALQRVDGSVAVQDIPRAHTVVADDPEEDMNLLWGKGVLVELYQR
jgi:hypothetical protein